MATPRRNYIGVSRYIKKDQAPKHFQRAPKGPLRVPLSGPSRGMYTRIRAILGYISSVFRFDAVQSISCGPSYGLFSSERGSELWAPVSNVAHHGGKWVHKDSE